MAKTVAQIASNWQQGMQSKQANYTAGIQATTVNPMQLAAAQADKAVANYSAAKGRMVAGLNGASQAFWKSQSVAGAAKWSQGAAKGMTKYTASMTKMTSTVYPAMKAAAAAAGTDPGAKAMAAVNALVAAKQAGQT